MRGEIKTLISDEETRSIYLGEGLKVKKNLCSDIDELKCKKVVHILHRTLHYWQ